MISVETIQNPCLDLERLRPEIDSALDRYSRFDNGCPAHLAEAIRYALLAPGKRIRPQLVLMATEACGGRISAAIPAACAVEMVHAYSLVHDDLPAMDDDDLRRGQLTCHKKFGEDVAVLVGDALLARAFEIMASDIKPGERAAACCGVLGKAAGATALVGGQAADLSAELSAGNVEQIEFIHSRKTGALFLASLQLGGIVAGADEESMNALATYGRQLGLAFQITDDLLDVAGDQAAVGKRLGKDEDRGKATFPGLLGVEESRSRAATAIEQACAAIDPFGIQADQLRGLAIYVLHRNR